MAHILVVDDDASIRDLVSEILGMHQHTVEIAENGLQAVEKVRKVPYDLVIIDRNMPTMTGIDAIKIIRSSPQFQKLKILMFTSASVVKEIDEAFEAGATGYLTKPLNIEVFLKKVQNTLK
ncbi:MAG: response regulator [Elusimicrobia bacterium]|nr:response regulator [Elusimicrobiota bacterium]